MGHIICGNCHRTHHTAAQVKACHFPPPIPVQRAQTMTRDWKSEPVSHAQLDYIARLNGDPIFAAKLLKGAASEYIDSLKKGRTAVSEQPLNNRNRTIVPLDMIFALPDKGNYAVRHDSNEPFTFFRITRPKGGLFKGLVKIQTQHGPNYKLMMTVSLGESQHVVMYDKSFEDQLLLVVVDPNGGMIAYGQELGYCCVCSTELTDARSRWYGIGPDCETRHGHIIDLVEDRKGPFTFGA